MLDYKDIIIKHYALHMSGRKIAEVIGASKSGVNDFLKAFERCESLSYPLPSGITNYGIAELVYGKRQTGKKGGICGMNSLISQRLKSRWPAERT